MQVFRERDYVTVPWKNGGGLTREILKVPTDTDSFDWRLSLATIATPGPFSAFADYARTLVLVRGAGVVLSFGPHGGVRLDSPGQAAHFDGAWPTSCELIDGPSTDLNLIVAKTRVASQAQVLSITAPERMATAGWDTTLVCCLTGSVRLICEAGAEAILSGADVARCSPDDGGLLCRPHGPSTAQVLLATVRPLGNDQS